MQVGDPRLPDRFWAKVSVALSGCWLWTAAKNRSRGGYGVFSPGGGRNGLAHRVAYESLREPIPSHLQADHLCRVRHCVNPEHMELVTPEENSHRGARVRRHCRNGHWYTTSTVYFFKTKRYGVQRGCRTCQKQAWRRVNLRRRLGLVAR